MKKIKFIIGLCVAVNFLFAFQSSKPIVTKEQKVEISTRFGKIIVKLYNETPLHRDNFIKLVKQGFYDSLLFHRVIPTFIIQGGDPTSKDAVAGKVLGEGNNGYRIPAEINSLCYHKRGALAAARDNNPDKSSSGCQFYIVQGKTFTMAELSSMENNANMNAKSQLFNNLMNSDSIRTKVGDFTLRGDKAGLHFFMLSMQDVIDSIYAPQEFKFTQSQVYEYTQVGGAPHLDLNYTVFGEVVTGLDVMDAILAQKTDSLARPLVDLKMSMKLIK